MGANYWAKKTKVSPRRALWLSYLLSHSSSSKPCVAVQMHMCAGHIGRGQPSFFLSVHLSVCPSVCMCMFIFLHVWHFIGLNMLQLSNGNTMKYGFCGVDVALLEEVFHWGGVVVFETLPLAS